MISEKTDPDKSDIQVKIRRNDKIVFISPDQFKREFRLIYDIPINPLERLPQLLKEIKLSQQIIGNKVAALRKFLNDSMSGIKDSKDPNLLARIMEQIEAEKVTNETMKTDLEKKKEYVKRFHEYFLTKVYAEIKENHEEVKT